MVYTDMGRVRYDFDHGRITAWMKLALVSALASVRGVRHPARPNKSCAAVVLLHFNGDVIDACARAVAEGYWFDHIAVESTSLPARHGDPPGNPPPPREHMMELMDGLRDLGVPVPLSSTNEVQTRQGILIVISWDADEGFQCVYRIPGLGQLPGCYLGDTVDGAIEALGPLCA